jgi:hypothetical protein
VTSQVFTRQKLGVRNRFGKRQAAGASADSQLRSGEVHKAEPLFQTVPPVTLFSSLKSLTFRLWDEERHRLVGFSHL